MQRSLRLGVSALARSSSRAPSGPVLTRALTRTRTPTASRHFTSSRATMSAYKVISTQDAPSAIGPYRCVCVMFRGSFKSAALSITSLWRAMLLARRPCTTASLSSAAASLSTPRP